MSESGISWQADRTTKFKAVAAANYAAYSSRVQFLNDTYPYVYNTSGKVLDVDNEHFIVWMRPAALPNFRKLYGRIDSSIPKGTVLTFTVTSAFPVSGFSGKKSLVLSTVSWMGGKNDFLGIAYIVVGFVCLGVAGAFFIRQRLGTERRLGDAAFLAWESRRA